MTRYADIPVFPLQTVLFPGGPLRLRIFEPRYTAMVSRCLQHGAPFMVSAVTSGDEIDTEAFEDVGTLARITDFETLSDGLLGIAAEGGERVRLLECVQRPDGLRVGTLETLERESSVELPDEYAGLACLVREMLLRFPELYRGIATRFGDASWVGYRLAEILPLALEQKQYFLEMEDPVRRLDILHPLLEAMSDGGIDDAASDRIQ